MADAARPLLVASLGSLLVACVLGVAGSLALPADLDELDWWGAHGWVALAGCVLPALAFLHLHLVPPRTGKALEAGAPRRLAALSVAASTVAALAALLPDSRAMDLMVLLGLLLLVGVGVLQLVTVLRLLPARGSSVVDVAADPITKGDDACLKHVKLAHFMLPLGLLLVAAAHAPGVDGLWATRLRLSGFHVLLVGYGMLSVYGLSHLVVPRLSGVPAIAAGAIKGELHSSLLGIVLLLAGFLAWGTDAAKGLLIAGGAFAFLGTFTFMGVLGANIMRNKSRTQRVTPEFTYVPWTFAAVFWLVGGVLLGIFLNAVPDLLAHKLPMLRLAHVHGLLAGGFVQLLLGFCHRLLPAGRGLPPPRFDGTAKLAFLGFNTCLCVLVVGGLTSGPAGTAFVVGGVLVTLSVAASFMSLAASVKGPVTP